MAERSSAEARLERLLYILPAAARAEGVTLDELAGALGVPAAEVMRDLEEATARAYYHPAGSVDAFEIVIDSGRVRVWSPAEFRRPVRLSPHEVLALGLGLRTLAAEAEAPRRAEILALAHRLETELAPASLDPAPAWRAAPDVMETHAEYDAAPGGAEPLSAYGIELGDDGFRGAVAEAAQLHRRCRIQYLKPGDDAPRERLIDPYNLVYVRGSWYVLAHDESRSAVRVFRMDRILEAIMTEEPFEVPPDFDPASYIGARGTPYRPTEPEQAVVRYSPRVARWLAESLDREADPDGGLVLSHDVADPRWVVRHVLQYAGEAELVEPRELRERVARAAIRVAERAA
jgi:proteasome accessory factor C